MLEKNTWSKVYRTSSNIGKKPECKLWTNLEIIYKCIIDLNGRGFKNSWGFHSTIHFFSIFGREGGGGERIWLPPKKICLLPTISPMKNHWFICPTQFFVVSSFRSIGIKTWGPLRQETDCSVNNNNFFLCLKVQHP